MTRVFHISETIDHPYIGDVDRVNASNLSGSIFYQKKGVLTTVAILAQAARGAGGCGKPGRPRGATHEEAFREEQQAYNHSPNIP